MGRRTACDRGGRGKGEGEMGETRKSRIEAVLADLKKASRRGEGAAQPHGCGIPPDLHRHRKEQKPAQKKRGGDGQKEVGDRCPPQGKAGKAAEGERRWKTSSRRRLAKAEELEKSYATTSRRNARRTTARYEEMKRPPRRRAHGEGQRSRKSSRAIERGDR